MNEKKHEPKLERMSTLLGELSDEALVGDSWVYVTDEDSMLLYIEKTDIMTTNNVFKLLKMHVKTRVKNTLLTNYFRIKSMKTILTDHKIPANTTHTVFKKKPIQSLERNEKRFVLNHSGAYPALSFFLEPGEFSEKIKIEASRKSQLHLNDGEIHFEFDPSIQHDIDQFLSHSDAILESLDPLIKNK